MSKKTKFDYEIFQVKSSFSDLSSKIHQSIIETLELYFTYSQYWFFFAYVRYHFIAAER